MPVGGPCPQPTAQFSVYLPLPAPPTAKGAVCVCVPQTAQQSPLLPQQRFHLVSLRPREKMDMGRRSMCAFEAGSDHFAGTSRGLVTQSMIQEKGTWASHSADTWLPHEWGGWRRPRAGPCKVHASCPGLRVVGQNEWWGLCSDFRQKNLILESI